MESPDKNIDLVASLAPGRDFKSAEAELERLKKGNDTSSVHRGEVYYLEGLILYAKDSYREALKKAQQAYQILKHTLKNQRIAQVQVLLGYIFIDLGDLKKAFRRAGDEKGLVYAYNKLAQISFIRAEFKRSIESLNHAIEHAKKMKEGPLMIARLSGNLGRIYLLMGEWENAQTHIYESIRQNERAGSQASICNNLLSLGYAACQQRKFKDSEQFLDRAHKIIRKRNLKKELAYYYEYRAEWAFEQKKYDQSYRDIIQAIEIGEETAPRGSLVCQSWRILAQVQHATQRLNLAEGSLQKALDLSKHLNEKVEEGIADLSWLSPILLVPKRELLVPKSLRNI
jgi:tetratricopeptide (TPR) repeat protein